MGLGCGLVAFILLLGCLLILLVSAGRPTNDRDNTDAGKQREMVSLILKIGDLAPIPKDAHIKTVKTEGNTFTRSFRLVFETNEKSIRKWLSDSKGVRSASTADDGSGTKYVLKPKCGFDYAEIKVDSSVRTVAIYVSHS